MYVLYNMETIEKKKLESQRISAYQNNRYKNDALFRAQKKEKQRLYRIKKKKIFEFSKVFIND